MSITAFKLPVAAILLCSAVNACTSDTNIVPHNGSFVVLNSNAMSDVEIHKMVKVAEDARVTYGMNTTKLARYVQHKFFYLYEKADCHCFVNIGEVKGSLVAKLHFIYLKSDTQDDLHILCFETTCGPDSVRVYI